MNIFRIGCLCVRKWRPLGNSDIAAAGEVGNKVTILFPHAANIDTHNVIINGDNIAIFEYMVILKNENVMKSGTNFKTIEDVQIVTVSQN